MRTGTWDSRRTSDGYFLPRGFRTLTGVFISVSDEGEGESESERLDNPDNLERSLAVVRAGRGFFCIEIFLFSRTVDNSFAGVTGVSLAWVGVLFALFATVSLKERWLGLETWSLGFFGRGGVVSGGSKSEEFTRRIDFLLVLFTGVLMVSYRSSSMSRPAGR